jgi:hypothetical protein
VKWWRKGGETPPCFAGGEKVRLSGEAATISLDSLVGRRHAGQSWSQIGFIPYKEKRWLEAHEGRAGGKVVDFWELWKERWEEVGSLNT